MRLTLGVIALAAVAAACGTSAPTPGSPAAPTPSAAAATPRPSPLVRWTFKTAGAVWGSATVAEGVVYVGSDDDNLYALDASTGAAKWKFGTGGDVRSKPALSDGKVIVSSDDGNVYALDATVGTQAWKVDIHNDLKRRPLNDPNPAVQYDFDFLVSSPVVAGGSVYAGSSDGSVYALDASSGSIRWTYKTGDKIRASAAVAAGLVYIGSWDGYLYALKADSGELAWKYKGGGDGDPRYLYLPIQSTAVVADGIVYGASRKADAFALDAATGAEKWQSPNGAGNWFESSPIAAGNRIYIGSSAGSNLFALDRAAGFSAGSFNTQGYAWSTPLMDGDTVFIGSESTAGSSTGKAGVWAVALDRMGSPDVERWFFATPDTLEPAGFNGVNSSPVLVERTLYFGGLDGVVYALDV